VTERNLIIASPLKWEIETQYQPYPNYFLDPMDDQEAYEYFMEYYQRIF